MRRPRRRLRSHRRPRKRKVAEWLNTLGITAFILRYRVTPYHHPCQIMDVTPQTPPAFLVHAIKDEAVAVMHSDLYAGALQKAGVPHEYMRGDFGGHGFSLQPFWTEPCATWLRHQQGGNFGPFARVKRLVRRPWLRTYLSR